ncbi:Origin recognition complex subunit [Musa troglodytarum]|uniref:Origin recognition complex subunit n=1 Tax=Musa troglodytarum TaxID=320322 RepID=A0A9E7FA36_9LILI|nr:Origin recognition complex subunit [Musa troglodytarum]
MSPSPISMPPSSLVADDTTGDSVLQPFFVLHKALPQKCERKAAGSTRTRRKIDLPPSSPKSPEKSDAVASSVGPNDTNYERLRLEAFNMTWSKIDTTIKEILTRVHRSLFAEVHQWALESFLALKSGEPRNAFEIQSPYPLLDDVICKQIPTAMILTKNAEFVDDMLTFQELGEHLKSKGCHIANLSAMDFCAKDGIAGCLRSLLRQLVMDAPDLADMSVLSSWYCEPENYDHPVIIVIDDMERCCGAILADFIRLLSEWVMKLPVIFIMGVATTDTAKKLLPSDALQHLQSSKFTLGSPLERMNALVEAVLVKPSFGFNIGHNVAVFMRNYFLGHDGTITSFVRALKLACVKHFSMEPLSFLGIDILDENQVILYLLLYSWFSYMASVMHYLTLCLNMLLIFHLLKEALIRGKDCTNSRDDLEEGLSDLRKLLKAWSSVILCLYEVGKHNKIQLLDIFCEATDPTLSSLDPSNHKLERSFNGQNLAEGRELPLSSLIKLLDLWSIHTEELCEVHGEVRELQSVVKSSNNGNNLKERQIDCHRMSMSLCAGRTSLSVNGKAAALLDYMVRKFLMPIECLCFHEIICFRNVDILQSALIGNPRRNIQIDLMKSTTYMKCSCCCSTENVLSPTMHDTSVMYNLAQEHGDLISLQDWYHSFKSTVLSTNKLKCPLQHSPMSKKVKSSPSESEASIQARFCRAVIELQIAGLIRMPSKKRPDFVQRVAFGL